MLQFFLHLRRQGMIIAHSMFFLKRKRQNSCKYLTPKEKFLLLQEGTKIFHGVGIYDKRVHLDVREEIALWTGESR